MDIFRTKFDKKIARIGNITIYEYSIFQMYLIRDDAENGAWLQTTLEAAMKTAYEVLRKD